MRTRIHIGGIIAYLIQVTIIWSCYYFLQNHFLLMALVVVLSALPISIISVIVLHHYIDLQLEIPERRTRKGASGFLTVSVVNPSVLISMDVKFLLNSENEFYGESGKTKISVPARARGTYEKQLPIEYSMSGRYHFYVDSITVRDFLGIISLKKKVKASAEVDVIPQFDTMAKEKMTDMSKGMTESEETMKKGHDLSEVSDVREYIPGDRLMSIHWKLSAKRDILMVKDRVSMSDQQMVMLTELCGTPEQMDEILSLSYNVANAFIADQIFVRFLWWSTERGEFIERRLMSRDDLDSCFSEMYYEKLYRDFEMTRNYMQSIHPELTAYINVTCQIGEPEVVVVEL